MGNTLRLSSRPQAGFTLVELLVALLLSMLIAVALLKIQVGMGRQTVQSSDVGTRDAQIRAAMDMITTDLSSGGFLFTGSQNKCNALLTYNTSGYAVRHTVDAQAAVTGTTLPFAPSLTLAYPPAGSTIPSDVLSMTGSTSTTNLAVYQVTPVSNSAVTAPMTTGMLQMAPSPQEPPFNAVTGDVGVLQVVMGGKDACMRVPLTVAGNVVTSSGATMPSNFYTGFGSQLAAAGFTGTLSNASIYAQSALVDLGPQTTAVPLEQTVVYYVAQTATFPVLMRATFSLLNDTAIASAPAQAVAAGVASMQVLFGVDPGNTGAITKYENGATVASNMDWDSVLSVRIALVTRTLSDDTSLSPVTTSYAIGAPFAASVPVPAAFQYRRFNVQQTEIFTRDRSWM